MSDSHRQYTAASEFVSDSPLGKYHPTLVELLPLEKTLNGVTVPSFTEMVSDFASASSHNDAEMMHSVPEYLSLVALGSPRIVRTDDIDPYLSRYTVPCQEEGGPKQTLRVLKWQGLAGAHWVRNLLVECM